MTHDQKKLRSLSIGLGILSRQPGAAFSVAHDEIFMGGAPEVSVTDANRKALEDAGWMYDENTGWSMFV